MFKMGLQVSPYKAILTLLYIIPHLVIFFKRFCVGVKSLTRDGTVGRWRNEDALAAHAINIFVIQFRFGSLGGLWRNIQKFQSIQSPSENYRIVKEAGNACYD